MLAWSAYIAGEIESAAGHVEVAEQHYERAIELARSSGATFLVGVATVGLLTVQTAAGRVDDALRGYRDVIDYFARTGNWTHLWTTLRNLAELLRRLGDDEPAAFSTRRPTTLRTPRSVNRGAGPARPGSADHPPGRRPRRGPAGHRTQPQPSDGWGAPPPAGRGAPGRLDEGLVADPCRVDVRAQGGDQPGRLGLLGGQRPDLAPGDVRVQLQVEGQPLAGVSTGSPGG